MTTTLHALRSPLSWLRTRRALGRRRPTSRDAFASLSGYAGWDAINLRR